MPYSYTTYSGDGSTRIYAIPFTFLSRTHVEVLVNSVLKTVTTDYVFLSDSSIQFVTAPAVGAVVRIQRNTPKTSRLVDFQDGSVLTEENLDTSAQQVFNIVQEALDSNGEASAGLAQAAAADADISATAAAASAASATASESGATTSASSAAASAAAAASDAASLNTNPFKNKLINGNFGIWQRGTALIGLTGAQTVYLADRWQTNAAGHTFNYTQQSFSLGDLPGEPAFFARYNITANDSGASSNCILQQKVEDVRTLAGKTVTATFYAKADTNRSVSVELTQNFGTGGTPSASVTNIGSTKLSLTSVWQKFTVTCDVPSIAGKTLGTAGNSFLGLLFWFSGGSSWNTRTGSLGLQTGLFDVALVQLESGSVATEFESRPVQVELALCQRYFEKSFPLATAPASGAGTAIGEARWRALLAATGQNGSALIPFQVRKRATPTIAIYNPSAAGAEARNLGTSANCSSTTGTASGENGFQVATVGDAGCAVANTISVHWTADAEL